MEITTEREDLLAMVADQRRNFLFTVADITDEQAATRTTVSELTLGGLVKHLAGMQRSWIAVVDGTAPAEYGWSDLDPDHYRMTPSETLAGLLDDFHGTCAAFDRALREEPDLDREVTLPRYPWSPAGPTVWTVRHILLHIFREITHHSGHADIIREALDGASTTARMAAAASEGQ
ncbi:DinB family protein [Actinocrinis puniceicyclus]|uniref:DinB family protein n=1 Tax=Actinocrinis puniceicyclus TaxID=977794 RepID=A0A8J8BBI1_9ACTN|nr:DinB family protein [Actinocrinis puniceicyclus]MBS2962500.1 DinB family protein [Actinocrinis puniceicyclus]